MAIDSHMHINSFVDSHVKQSISAVLNDQSLDAVINVGLDLNTSREAISIAQNYPKFYASVGIHPLYLRHQDVNLLYPIAVKDRVVAIGEIGLDMNSSQLEMQKKYFIDQLILANDLHLPVIIHANHTNAMVLDIFKRIVKPKYGCVFHCFEPDLDLLPELMEEGYYISFAGRITYHTAKRSHEIIKRVSNDLFLVETDSPYLAPEPFRNSINSSSNLHYIIDKLAFVKEMNYDEINQITTQNTKRLFRRME